MEYYSKIIPMYLLKNYIVNDPILDWFKIQNIKHDIYHNDKNNYFKKYIFNEIINYKNNFCKCLKNKIISLYPKKIIYQNTNVNKTIELVKNNQTIIFSPNLIHHKYNISVSCDILIKKKLFIEIFKDIQNINLHSIESNDYLIINIVSETVSFKTDGTTFQKNDVIDFNECSLYVFNSAMKQYTYRCDFGFIFAKGYKNKNDLLEKKKNIGLVKFNDKIRWKIIHAREWIQRLKNNNYRIINNTPPCIELYPNMNYNNTDFQEEKKKIAKKIKEITLIWRISYQARCELVKNGVNTWDIFI